MFKKVSYTASRIVERIVSYSLFHFVDKKAIIKKSIKTIDAGTGALGDVLWT
jgi:hypothetical protein